ncbi:exopolysaccharide biosynthesis protein [Nitratireductor basaltis]|uniref:Putative ABC-type transport system, permease component n=1 Tax=Nitratireductor basaltis TaxID=472175 RepID=A0A084UBS0_9HYPH|nr:exopolysaccharide biosynthesis protein [Nitratireductor basaltis]KFB10406.1 putative ABC-type transport system, permease component [Nitratireductor basaltis]
MRHVCRLAGMAEDDPHSINDILDRLHETAEDEKKVSIGQMMDAFGHRSYGPFLIVPPLIEFSPLGAIPGVPTFLAFIVFMFAVQILIGKKHFWLPDFVLKREISADKLDKGTRKARSTANFLDRHFHGRMRWLTTKPFIRVAAAITMLLTLAVPPLELLPFASTGPMLAIATLGLALLVRDGMLMILASLIAIAAVGAGLWFFVGG